MRLSTLLCCFILGYLPSFGQDNEEYVTSIDTQKIALKSLETKYTNNDAWRSWYLSTDAGRVNLYMPYSGDRAWQEWRFENDLFDAMITTVHRSSKDAWKSWDWQGKLSIDMFTTYNNSEDPWKSWEVQMTDKPEEHLQVRVRYSSTDKSWAEWVIEHEDPSKGTLRLQTRYVNGKDMWMTWDIIDEMPNVHPELKSAAIFVALFSAIMPYCHPKGACSLNGFPLKGKVKFVESGEDFTIKYVQYDADIRVKFVDYGADDCGEWQEVKSGEDFKVKIVTWDEDLKVEKVQFSPGMRE